MAQITYRGPVETLQGTSWQVPESVLQAGQGAAWVESQHRQQLAEEAAAAEAAQRQQELLAARIEQQRLAAEAQAAMPPITREDLKAELVNELDALTRSVLTGAAAVESKELAIIQRTDDWEARHEELLTGAETRITEAEAQVQAAQAVTQASSEQVQAELDNHRLEVRNLESELRTTVAGLIGPQGEVGQRGLAGSSITITTDDPTRTEPSSWAQRWYGRPELVPGDSALLLTPNGVRTFRFVGSGTNAGWVEGGTIEPKVIAADVKASVLQQNQPAIVGAGGGGTSKAGSTGAGGEPLLIRSITGTAGYQLRIADGSRWSIPLHARGWAVPQAAQVILELTAADGPKMGKKLYLAAGIVFEGGNTGGGAANSLYTEFSLMGALEVDVSVAVEIAMANATIPPGITLPPAAAGTLSPSIYLTIKGNASGATNFLVAGAVEWALPHEGTPHAAGTPGAGGIEPAWEI